ncbi:MAG: response regulator [Verrucomicrobia bacterium]|nr:response regulator [Verrucomicrobiota bacterium]
MTKTRILIVDDDPNLARLSSLILERAGAFETRIENLPGRALQTVRDFRPDVILMDVDMPGRNGAEVAAQIRAEPGLPQPRILYFTALVSRQECPSKPLQRGGEEYLAKPVDPDLLVEIVEQMTRPAQSPLFA